MWSFDDTQTDDTYRMTRCTYGATSSSYHSILSLTNCADGDNVPLPVQQAIRRDFYVGYVLTGTKSVSEARRLQIGLIATLKQSQFDVRKWISNTPGIFPDLPEEYREANENFEFLAIDHTITIKGIIWNPSSDTFLFKISHIDGIPLSDKHITKREMLSDLSKTFDPLGWLSPMMIVLKQLMQQPGKANIDWDGKLPHDIASKYLSWGSKLPRLKEIKLRKFSLFKGFSDKIQLPLFSDASERAYAVSVYIAAVDSHGKRHSSVLAGKFDVAPLKTLSAPSLEPCAALLGFRLMKSILKTTTIKFHN